MELLLTTKKEIEGEYSQYNSVNVDYIKTKKAMFYENVYNLFSDLIEKRGN